MVVAKRKSMQDIRTHTQNARHKGAAGGVLMRISFLDLQRKRLQREHDNLVSRLESIENRLQDVAEESRRLLGEVREQGELIGLADRAAALSGSAERSARAGLKLRY